jgi:hypothetical protein
MTGVAWLAEELLAPQEGLPHGVNLWNCTSYFGTEDLYVVCGYLFAVAHQKLRVHESHDGTDSLNVEKYCTCSCWTGFVTHKGQMICMKLPSMQYDRRCVLCCIVSYRCLPACVFVHQNLYVTINLNVTIVDWGHILQSHPSRSFQSSSLMNLVSKNWYELPLVFK